MTKRLSVSIAIITCLALLAAMAGASYAAATQSGKENQATASKKGKVKRGARGKRGAQGIQGAQGAQGARGAQGPQGPAGAPGKDATSLWAQVTGAGGVLGRNSPAVSASDLGSAGNGTYEVIFDRDITNCVYMGTLGGPTNQTFPGEISVAQRSAQPNGVFVATSNSSGTGTDLSFYVAVFC